MFQKITPFFLIATLIFFALFYFVNVVTTLVKGSELQKPSLKFERRPSKVTLYYFAALASGCCTGVKAKSTSLFCLSKAKIMLTIFSLVKEAIKVTLSAWSKR